MLWAAAWLHKASRRREYREYIVKNEVVLRAGDTINEFGWDNKHAGINVLLSKVYYFTLITPHLSRSSYNPHPTPPPNYYHIRGIIVSSCPVYFVWSIEKD